MDELDLLLGEEVGRRLGPQAGRARGAFVAHVRAQRRRRMAIGLAAGLALAACAAWVFLGMFSAREPERGQIVERPPQRAVEGDLRWAAYSQGVDAGTVVVDGVPLRQWRQRLLEEAQWKDEESGAMITVRVPRERIVLTGARMD